MANCTVSGVHFGFRTPITIGHTSTGVTKRLHSALIHKAADPCSFKVGGAKRRDLQQASRRNRSRAHRTARGVGPLLINDFDVDEVIATVLSERPSSELEPLQSLGAPTVSAVFVPAGLHDENGVVRTTETPSAFKGIMDLTYCGKRLAVPTGFEPVPIP